VSYRGAEGNDFETARSLWAPKTLRNEGSQNREIEDAKTRRASVLRWGESEEEKEAEEGSTRRRRRHEENFARE
jgi:hypothetical protein